MRHYETHLPPFPQTKEDNKHCQLRVEALPDNYVVFEALHSPGEFVAIGSNGAPPDKVKGLGSTDKETQFFVRVEVHVY